MKKKILLLVFFTSICVNAQKKNIIKANPLGFVFGSYSIGYERAISKNKSFQIDVNSTNFSRDDVSVSGGGIALSFRNYIRNNEVFKGWYLSPLAGYSSLKFEGGDSGVITFNGAKIEFEDSIDSKVFSFSMLIGHQWNWSLVILDLYAGPSLVYLDVGDAPYPSESTGGIGLVGGLSLGFVF